MGYVSLKAMSAPRAVISEAVARPVTSGRWSFRTSRQDGSSSRPSTQKERQTFTPDESIRVKPCPEAGLLVGANHR